MVRGFDVIYRRFFLLVPLLSANWQLELVSVKLVKLLCFIVEKYIIQQPL